MARIQQLTITDDTTGLFNVRHLYDVLGRELERCSRERIPVSLAFLDLDRFKQVNDVHGHLIGSELLSRAGPAPAGVEPPAGSVLPLRRRRVCGGDARDRQGAKPQELAPTSHRELTTTRFRMNGKLELTVSASVGLATAPEDGSTIHTIIGAADARMYEVKTEGRGRVRGAFYRRSCTHSSRWFVALLVGQLLQLIAPIERVDEGARLAPAWLDNDMQFEIDTRSQQRLDLLAGAGADLLQLGSALADEDRFLPIALAVDGRGDARQRESRRSLAFLPWRCGRFGLFISLNHDRRGVGHFFAGIDEDPFANQFGDHEAHGLVGVLIFGIVALAGGQHVDDLAQQQIEAVAFARTDGNDLSEVELFGQCLDQGQQTGPWRPGRSWSAQERPGSRGRGRARRGILLHWPRVCVFSMRLSRSAGWPVGDCFDPHRDTARFACGFKLHAAAGVDQHQHQVAGFESFVDFLQHPPVELRSRLVHAGRIDKNDLRRRDARSLRAGTSTTPAMRLRVVCGLGVTMATFSPDEGVQQRAFAGVRPAEDGDKSRFQRGKAPD